MLVQLGAFGQRVELRCLALPPPRVLSLRPGQQAFPHPLANYDPVEDVRHAYEDVEAAAAVSAEAATMSSPGTGLRQPFGESATTNLVAADRASSSPDSVDPSQCESSGSDTVFGSSHDSSDNHEDEYDSSDNSGSTAADASALGDDDDDNISDVKIKSGKSMAFVIDGGPSAFAARTMPHRRSSLSEAAAEAARRRRKQGSGIKRDRAATIVAPPHPPHHVLPTFDFVYKDSDSLENDLNEFFGFHDFGFCAHGRSQWDSERLGDLKPSDAVQSLLERMLTKKPSTRITAAYTLLYFAQGVFMENQTNEEQLAAIRSNCKLLYDLDAFDTVYAALRVATASFESLSRNVPSDQAAQLSSPATNAADTSADANASQQTSETQIDTDMNVLENNLHLSILYILIVVNMRNPDFVTSVSESKPYLPVYIFALLSRLAEGNRQIYPVKKLLLVLWKVIATIRGSDADYASYKAEAREACGLAATQSADKSSSISGAEEIKSPPAEYHGYHMLLSHRYPGYVLPDPLVHIPGVMPLMLERVPVHLRKLLAPFYERTQQDALNMVSSLTNASGDVDAITADRPLVSSPIMSVDASGSGSEAGGAYQSSPILDAAALSGRTNYSHLYHMQPLAGCEKDGLPTAIREAVGLYGRHAYVSTSSMQLVVERLALAGPMDENHILDAAVAGMLVPDCESADMTSTSDSTNILSLFAPQEHDTGYYQQQLQSYTEFFQYQRWQQHHDQQQEKSSSPFARLSVGLQRYKRLYENLLPHMSAYICMLVRLLYYLNLNATSDSNAQGSRTNQANGGDNQHSSDGSSSPNTTPITTDDIRRMSSKECIATLERLDSVRHREVLTLAISGIIMSFLQAAKCFHVLAFENISQLLYDNNCAILILKLLSSWFPNPAAAAKATGASGANGADESHAGHNKIDAAFLRAMQWLRARSEPAQLTFFAFCRGGPDFESSEMSHAGNDHAGKDADANPSVTASAKMQQDAHKLASSSHVAGASKPTKLPSKLPLLRGISRSLPHEFEATVMQPSSHRAFTTTIHLLRILHKLTKRKPQRILSLVQWKASAVLRRILRIHHAALAYYALKLLKSQVPHLNKKWRNNNMHIITMIYLQLKPSLRDEYLVGDVEDDVVDANAMDVAMRDMVAAFHERWFGTSGSQSASATDMAASAQPFSLSASGKTPLHASTTGAVPLGSFAADSSFSTISGDTAHLDDNFMENYEQWLLQEVYQPQELWADETDASADDMDDADVVSAERTRSTPPSAGSVSPFVGSSFHKHTSSTWSDSDSHDYTGLVSSMERMTLSPASKPSSTASIEYDSSFDEINDGGWAEEDETADQDESRGFDVGDWETVTRDTGMRDTNTPQDASDQMVFVQRSGSFDVDGSMSDRANVRSDASMTGSAGQTNNASGSNSSSIQSRSVASMDMSLSEFDERWTDGIGDHEWTSEGAWE